MPRQWDIALLPVSAPFKLRTTPTELAFPADDVADDKLEQAKACGADHVVNFKNSPLSECEQASSTIVISGAFAAYDNAITLTANHGTIITVGLPPGNWPIPSKSPFDIDKNHSNL